MVITLACGDPSGVGPEVTLKALSLEFPADDCSYRLQGDLSQLVQLNQTLGLGLPLSSGSDATDGRLRVVSARELESLPVRALPQRGVRSARAAMLWLENGAQDCLRGGSQALVTAPVCKETIMEAGYPDFVGQTEFLAGLAGVPDPIMMLLGADDRGRWLRVALATIHIPLAEVASRLTSAAVERAIGRSVDACRDLGLPQSRIGVCGLNPHAGEGGKIGIEEQTTIAPAIARARLLSAQSRIEGPIPADTLFYRAYRGEFDAVVAMYHDQGLAPLKMVAFESGVNWTLGLPFIRTSPDHGTAFDIAGQGVADPHSMWSAIRMAKRLAGNRGPVQGERSPGHH
ncbi:MAG: 4-hydroxythreonine-4-phosphate dehydrogenase PdxA [Verrucomicrobiales bacterium]|nr:4-hydroxythreonine-4-phosphate dehydrogenase PdxA [Verrucomicrobiales bacterium]